MYTTREGLLACRNWCGSTAFSRRMTRGYRVTRVASGPATTVSTLTATTAVHRPPAGMRRVTRVRSSDAVPCCSAHGRRARSTRNRCPGVSATKVRDSAFGRSEWPALPPAVSLPALSRDRDARRAEASLMVRATSARWRQAAVGARQKDCSHSISPTSTSRVSLHHGSRISRRLGLELPRRSMTA